MDHVVAGMTEPQFVGPHGIMRAELARRNGDIDSARAAIDDTIDRIEYCSDDLVRITAAAATGLRVEGDAGQLARDRRDAAADQHARERADALIARTRLSADSARAGGGGGAGHGGGRVRARDGQRGTPHPVARAPHPRGSRSTAPTPWRTRAGARPRH